MVLISIPLTTDNADILFMCRSLFGKLSVHIVANLKYIRLFASLLLSLKVLYIYILDTSTLLNMCFANILSSL